MFGEFEDFSLRKEANICDLEFKLALNYDTEIKFYVKRALKVVKFVLFFSELIRIYKRSAIFYEKLIT